MKKRNQSTKKLVNNNCVTTGNLALSIDKSQIYETPKIKKLIVKKTTKKIFMGCWQGCNEDNGGDGC